MPVLSCGLVEKIFWVLIFPNFTETSTEETRTIDNSKVEGKEVAALDKRRGASDRKRASSLY